MKLRKRILPLADGDIRLFAILPYLPPPHGYFFDSRHWVYDTTDGILPFSVTTRIDANSQQYLLYYEET
jgi:hypothetical protein